MLKHYILEAILDYEKIEKELADIKFQMQGAKNRHYAIIGYKLKNINNTQVAKMTGYSVRSVREIWKKYQKQNQAVNNEQT